MNESVNEIRNFVFDNELRFSGKMCSAKAIVYNNNRIIFDDWVEFRIYHDVKHEQYNIDIDWLIPDSTWQALGLHLGYNTSYQRFEFKNNVLIIINDNDCKNNVEIHISV